MSDITVLYTEIQGLSKRADALTPGTPEHDALMKEVWAKEAELGETEVVKELCNSFMLYKAGLLSASELLINIQTITNRGNA